jgi:small-conductance mechanosensitive channel
VKVNLAYGSDVRQAHAALLEIARAHPMVLKNPEPFVLLANFGPGAIEFEIRVFLADILNGNTVQNDIRFQVLDAFERDQLEMPSTTPRASAIRDAEKPEEEIEPVVPDPPAKSRRPR